MIKQRIKQIQRFAGKKGTKIRYNEYNNTIMVTFYPTMWATASEIADSFQAVINHVGGYDDIFRVDKIRSLEYGLLSYIELHIPQK